MCKILSFQHVNSVKVTSSVFYILIFLLSSESNACFVMTARLDLDETELRCSRLLTVTLDSADGDERSCAGLEANGEKMRSDFNVRSFLWRCAAHGS